MFVLKQINNKVNTTVFSTTIICLILLLTIGILSSSISLVGVFNSAVSSNNMTDFTISEILTEYNTTDGTTYCFNKNTDNGIYKLADKTYFKEYIKEHAYYHIYSDDNGTIIVDDSSIKKLHKEYGYSVYLDGLLDIISESDYNKVLELYEKEKTNLSNDEYLLASNLDVVSKYYESFYKNNGTIIVDDSLLSNLKPNYGIIVGNYIKSSNVSKVEEDFISALSEDENGNIAFRTLTKIDMETANINVKAVFTFIGLYLGIVFAISSATVLAIGQLSEASNNK